MDTAPTRKQLTHDRIVRTAAHAIRGAGFAGIGVADVMKRAGLTHGGFYAHFPSRDDLLAEALEQAGHDSRERLKAGMEASVAKGHSRFRALVDNYLADRHLRSPDTGCPVAALGSEMPRQTAQVRDAAVVRVEALLSGVADALGPKAPAGAAGVVAGQLVGTLQLARTLGDNARGRALLVATRRSLLEQFDSPPARKR
ncbi:TetR/AcrR family transcriptional regulator [Ramlibacter humi]|uniref:TetR/AcrR family transcriptional regulator n=1 Tax=Ramlibacter humi TaxID=2530451 RepID=A0A4Z0BG13_9BURK|nr:TetR/AcrR family transcriptional regulator [Ramlibacter humi]TFY97730.1 TetR/AcrR family transcriptional regulator [Ramlibacter humi]